MKLERLSENQIRCTLNKNDLEDRELVLTELAYGTDKARELFRDIMEQASEELGFEANDIHLMIEAIPVSPECLILIITKVDDPEELDTRFARYSKYTDMDLDDDEEDDDDIGISLDNGTEKMDFLSNAASLMETISDIVENIEKAKMQSKAAGEASKNISSEGSSKRITSQDTDVPDKKSRKDNGKDKIVPYNIFSFRNIHEVSKAAAIVVNLFDDSSALYKNPVNHHYYLLIHHTTGDINNYQRACNCFSEYGTKVKANYATPYYFFEHFQVIIKDHAIEKLSSI